MCRLNRVKAPSPSKRAPMTEIINPREPVMSLPQRIAALGCRLTIGVMSDETAGADSRTDTGVIRYSVTERNAMILPCMSCGVWVCQMVWLELARSATEAPTKGVSNQRFSLKAASPMAMKLKPRTKVLAISKYTG